MGAELWRQDDTNWALYIDAVHAREIRNIKRSRDWSITATYQKGEEVVGLQWRVSNADYRAAKRIEQRINSVPNSVEKPAI